MNNFPTNVQRGGGLLSRETGVANMSHRSACTVRWLNTVFPGFNQSYEGQSSAASVLLGKFTERRVCIIREVHRKESHSGVPKVVAHFPHLPLMSTTAFSFKSKSAEQPDMQSATVSRSLAAPKYCLLKSSICDYFFLLFTNIIRVLHEYAV